MSQNVPKHRLFVLSDALNEPDDSESFVRLLLYSDVIEIEGVAATTSTWIRNEVHPEEFHRILDGYEAVYNNLQTHSDYPSAEYVRSLVTAGYPAYGMAGVGPDCDSDGSRALIAAIDKDHRPLYVALWGGANCLAQALWRVRNDRTAAEVEHFIGKIRVHGISDQDDAGPWLRRAFPSIPYVVSLHAENQYQLATWIGITSELMGAKTGATLEYITKEWLAKHIQIGPLGSTYPDVKFGMEGDTSSFLACIPNGLNDPERPDYGGWGGRYKKLNDPEAQLYLDTIDEVVGVDGQKYSSPQATLWRWRDAFQLDFASRMRRTLDDYKGKKEHHPVVVIDNDATLEPVRISANLGETMTFNASRTYDPDGGQLVFKWYQYREVLTELPGTEPEVKLLDLHNSEHSPILKVTMPNEIFLSIGHRSWHEHEQDYHFILEVTAIEKPFPLTRYRRMIVTVRKSGST